MKSSEWRKLISLALKKPKVTYDITKDMDNIDKREKAISLLALRLSELDKATKVAY